MGPTWDPPGSCRPQVGPMLAPWTLLSGLLFDIWKLWCFYSWGYQWYDHQTEYHDVLLLVGFQIMSFTLSDKILWHFIYIYIIYICIYIYLGTIYVCVCVTQPQVDINIICLDFGHIFWQGFLMKGLSLWLVIGKNMVFSVTHMNIMVCQITDSLTVC